jgi:vitamin B12 transporter
MSKNCPRLLAAFLFVLVPISFCVVQQSSAQSTSILNGTVTDPAGRPVPGVQVTVEKVPGFPGATPAQVVTGDGGRFQFMLSPGTYRLRVTHPQFARVEQLITLAAGETREWRARLELERLSTTVVVTADAQPVSASSATAPVSIISRQQIEQLQAISLGPLLARQTGFSVTRLGRAGSVTSLFLDGGNSNFTKVLVDGTTVNEPGGAIDFSNFTLDNVEKIEIVRGAESALYGSDAMSGVVQIFTHRGDTSRPRFVAEAEGGKFSTARGSGQLSGQAGRFDYSAAASYFTTAGQGVNDGFLNRTLSANFGWKFNSTDALRLTLRNNTSDARAVGQTLFEPPNLDQHDGLRNLSANLSADFATGEHWSHHLAGTEAYDRQLFSNELSDFFVSPDPFGSCAFPRSPQAVPSSQFCDFPFVARNLLNRAGLLAQSSYFFAQGQVTAGYQYEVENAFLSALSDQHARRNNQAGFLDTRWQVWRRVTLSGGARAEANANFGTRVVPRVGAAFALRLSQGLWGPTQLRVSYGEGVKEPRLDQSFGVDPCFPGNAALRPERSRTLNAGVEQTLASERVRVSAGYFYDRFYDMISFGSMPPPPGCVLGFAGNYFNTDLARARGVNMTVEARPMRWLTISGNYTFDDSRVLKSPNAFDPATIEGNRLLRRPVHSGNLILNAGFRHMNWNFAGYFTGKRTDSDFLGLGFTSNAGYARFDLGASFDVRHGVQLFGRIENVFEKQYQEALGYPAYRRAYRLGTKLTLGGE